MRNRSVHVGKRGANATLIILTLAVFAASCTSTTTTTNRQRNATLGAVVEQTFLPGEGSFVVPDGVTAIDVSVSGAQGGVRRNQTVGSGDGGRGGRVSGQLTVTPGEALTIQVGERGADQSTFGAYPDGGAGGYQGQVYDPKSGDLLYNWNYPGPGGGGSSRIYRGEQLLAIAGGGGGAGERSNGGDGGQTGGDADARYGGGGGASQTAGGAGGCTTLDFDGTQLCSPAGEFLAGGSGDVAGSGGGGGYYGGGSANAVYYAGSGGGGSSWALEQAFANGVVYESGMQLGNGAVTISYLDPTATPTESTIAATTTTTTAPPVLPCQWGGPCQVGDIGPGGGVVFFNGTSPWNGRNSGPYLEASSEVIRTPWCDKTSTAIPGANENYIGGGKINQQAILKVCTSGAVKWVDDATWGEKTDWWLPNTFELTLLSNFWVSMFWRYAYTDQVAYQRWYNWAPYKCGWNWSSSGASQTNASAVFLGNGNVEMTGKWSNQCAVGIRLFEYGESSSLPMPTTTTSSTSTTESPSTTSTSTTTESTTATTVDVPTTSDSATTVGPAQVTETTQAPRTPATPAPTSTIAPLSSVPASQVAEDVARGDIASGTPPQPAAPRYADWVPVPTPQATVTGGSGETGNVDAPQRAELGEFSVDTVSVAGSKGPVFQVGIRLPQRAAKTITYALRIVGLQGQQGPSCVVTLKNSAPTKPKYTMRTTCRKASQKLVLVGKKKSFGSRERLVFQWPGLVGGSLLEVKSVVKGVRGTPVTGIWRSRLLYVR